MSLQVVTNTGLTPVNLDSAGHQLGGGEYCATDTDDPATAAQLAAGNLAVVDRPADLDPVTINPAVIDAFTRLDIDPPAVYIPPAADLPHPAETAGDPAAAPDAAVATEDSAPAPTESVDQPAESADPTPADRPTHTTSAHKRTAAAPRRRDKED